MLSKKAALAFSGRMSFRFLSFPDFRSSQFVFSLCGKFFNLGCLTLIQIVYMKKVSDILAHKGSNIISISPGTSVLDALKLMADKNIGSVMIMKDQQFLGIVTERDYSRKVILKGKSSTDTKVEDIMTINFPPVVPGDTIEHCMELMSSNTLRYLPVMENGSVKGLISMSDLVKATITGHEETISQLKDYLHASM